MKSLSLWSPEQAYQWELGWKRRLGSVETRFSPACSCDFFLLIISKANGCGLQENTEIKSLSDAPHLCPQAVLAPCFWAMVGRYSYGSNPSIEGCCLIVIPSSGYYMTFSSQRTKLNRFSLETFLFCLFETSLTDLRHKQFSCLQASQIPTTLPCPT